MIKSLSQTEVTQVVVTMWALWHAKRKIIHEGLFQSPLSTHCFIQRFIADLEVLAPAPSSTSERGPVAPRWIPPPSGVAKVNVDAVVSKNSSIAVIVAVAWSTAGEFLGASSIVLKGLSNPETLEALACREGLSVAADLLLQRVRVAIDCQNVIRSIARAGRGPYDRIGPPTVVVFVCLYSDIGIDDLHRACVPASAAVLAPASTGCLGLNSRLSRPLAGSYAFLGRLPRPCPSVLLLRHRPRHHRQRRHWIRSVCRPHHGAYNTDVGLINRSRACPRARAYHRSSIGLPRHCPFGLQRRRLWSMLPAFDAPSEACTLLVASRRCSDLRLAAMLVPRVVTLPHGRPCTPTSHATLAPPPLAQVATVRTWSSSRYQDLPRLLRVPPPHHHR
ncbi:hypothetical protein QYE76_066541 [Lolium multiflorum]|uniref:RNase H type-1 domain-containing protein n=1 Tax=Lolium multiflorum TaxID=4521 RepID=A0AAD8W9V3_LOLMU|nr:hypothetical protein QYE76_066541 [Lolium multiflorum]